MSPTLRRSNRCRLNLGNATPANKPGDPDMIQVYTDQLNYNLPGDSKVRKSVWKVSLSGSHAYDDNFNDQKTCYKQDLADPPELGLIQLQTSFSSPSTLESLESVVGKGPQQLNFVSSSDSDTNMNSLIVETTSVGISSDQKSAASDREKRLIRREAIMHTDDANDQQGANRSAVSGNIKRKKAPAKSCTGLKRKKAPVRRKKKNPKWLRRGLKEECDVVEMNTGILYLYRGLNRRVVFVRKK